MKAEPAIRTGRLSAAAFAGMFVFGIVMALLGAILPLVTARLKLDLAQTGDLFLAMNFGMLLASLACGPLMDRFGMKPPLAAGPAMVAVALVLIAPAATAGPLLASVFLLGAGGGAVNGASNTLVADLHTDPRRKNAALNLLGVFFGFGALFLPFIVGSLVGTLGLVRIIHLAAGLTALVAVFACTLAFPPAKQREKLPLAEIGRLLRAPLVPVLGALLFFESGNEFILGGYITTFLTREIGSTVAAASYVLAGYWASLMVARVFLSRLLLRWQGHKLVMASAAGAALGAFLMARATSQVEATAAVLLTGLSLSGIFPTVLGMAGTTFQSYSGTVFGILFTMALTGGMTLPWATARVAQASGMRAGLDVVAGGFVAILVLQSLAIWVGRRSLAQSVFGNRR